MTLQTALAVLQAEGLIASVPRYGWQILPIEEHVTFDLFSTMLAQSPLGDWAPMVVELLEHRADQVIAAVDALMVSGDTDISSARLWFNDIARVRDRRCWSTTCRAEDQIFTALLAAEGNRAKAFAAHQLRRTLESVRRLINLEFFVDPQAGRFEALFDAIDRGERNRAVALAAETVTRRDPVYLRLVAQLVQKLDENRRESTVIEEAANGLT